MCSWQQTPAGSHLEIAGKAVPPGHAFEVADLGRARMVIDDFWGVVFNPSSMDRLSHTLVAAWSAGAFLVISVAAFYLIRRRHVAFAAISLKSGLILALAASLLSLTTGHHSAAGVAKNQPSKLAAMAGIWQTAAAAPLHPFGWVDTTHGHTLGPMIPAGLSLLVGGRRRAARALSCHRPGMGWQRGVAGDRWRGLVRCVSIGLCHGFLRFLSGIHLLKLSYSRFIPL